MKVGPVVRPKQESLGDAMVLKGKPPLPARPEFHKSGAPPTMNYHKGHPMLTAPAVPGAMPVRATQGVSQTQLGGYIKALQRGGQ